ncbi:hypothetical protein [Aeoliella sp. SH292]|uniref:hypothetical protein n=1 Tax=Aeoliella sp. SH292 TaxID=3454464 RepID=UPI003F95CECB
MLATLLLAMALSIGLLLWELIPLRAEVQRLRNEAGYLTVDDPSKLQAIRLDSDSPLVWRWKVWIPKGTGTVFANAMIGDIPASGDFVRMSGGAGIARERDQETVVTVKVYQDLHLDWTLSCEIGGAQIRRTLTAEEVAAIRDKRGYSREGVGNTTQAGDDGKYFILLRERFAAPGAGFVDFGDQDSAGKGMLVWLQAK